jgi:ABC-2 type transport system permease protein
MSRVVMLVARREVVSRLQQKGYRIGVLVTWVIIAVGVALPKLIGGSGPATYSIAVAGTHQAEVAQAVRTVAAAEHVSVTVHDTSAADARAKVRAGTWDAAVIDADELVVKDAAGRAAAIAQDAYRSWTVDTRLTAAGLSGQQVATALTVPPLRVTSTIAAQTTQRQALATITVVFLFAQLITFCTWVAMGVVEEKSSRVVELVLSALRPVQLLTGKLLGIGALAIAQVVLLGGTALAVSTAVGTLSVPANAYAAMAASFVGFVLGFAFFAALAAALASLVSRQEEVSGVLSPMTVLLMVSYLGSFGVSSSPDSAFARAFSLIPPLSSIAMPARLARGGVPVVDVVVAVILLVAAAAGIVVLAARIYRAAILHTGGRLTLRRAWRGEAVGDLA